MKVTAFVGSARKKHTYNTCEMLLEKLKSFGNIETEIVCLQNFNLQVCKGCIACLDRGEEYCPLTDDRDLLINKMKESDGVIFATPNYSFNVSALMKIFLDRLAYFGHRPAFFGKTFTSIVVQGIFGGEKIVKYLDFLGNAIGYNVVKGSLIKSLEPMTEKNQKKNEIAIEKQAKKFYKQLIKKGFKNPSLLELFIFRMSRSSIKTMLNENYRDYEYFKKNGWFDSDFYYPIKINILEKMFGDIFDKISVKAAKNRK
ncbi:MAG: NAD(P)H-dependent oxidoreductase [Candidatus Marinimicrobia bacterium]|nr:NAD(P)H-dependent oxidoreductase [Candidatus Neomarinimicrobiota bacterium]